MKNKQTNLRLMIQMLMLSRDHILRTLCLDEVVFPGFLLWPELNGQEFQGGTRECNCADQAELPGHRAEEAQVGAKTRNPSLRRSDSYWPVRSAAGVNTTGDRNRMRSSVPGMGG